MKYFILTLYYKWIVGECRHICKLCKYKEECLPFLKLDIALGRIKQKRNT